MITTKKLVDRQLAAIGNFVYENDLFDVCIFTYNPITNTTEVHTVSFFTDYYSATEYADFMKTKLNKCIIYVLGKLVHNSDDITGETPANDKIIKMK